MNIGNVEEKLGNFEKALELYGKALEIQIQTLGGEHVSSANTKYNMALIYRDQGQINQARILFQEAAAVYAQVYGADHSETVDALNQAKE
jgi:tetratricopeptide (TPR) repeat protein